VVYGVGDRTVQDAILAELRAARGKDFKPVYVIFKQRVLREATIRR
jgi:hypothetical protein